MYVAPEARGQGAGHALLKAAIDQARTLNGVVEVFLAVTVGNPAARHLYLSAGFVPYAVEPRFLYVQGNYYDIEWLSLRFDNP
jgi:GNAT superfamily N-acetyltransferase